MTFSWCLGCLKITTRENEVEAELLCRKKKNVFTDPYNSHWDGRQKLQVPCSLWKCEVILTDGSESEQKSAIPWKNLTNPELWPLAAAKKNIFWSVASVVAFVTCKTWGFCKLSNRKLHGLLLVPWIWVLPWSQHTKKVKCVSAPGRKLQISKIQYLKQNYCSPNCTVHAQITRCSIQSHSGNVRDIKVSTGYDNIPSDMMLEEWEKNRKNELQHNRMCIHIYDSSS